MQRPKPIIERYGYLFAILCVAVATGVFFFGRDYFAKGQWALLYLLIIGLVAGLSGWRPALLAAVISFLTWNYYLLPPFHTFLVADPKDWLSLFVFLIVGITMGLQTGRMREREAEAHAREREMTLLNEFSAHLVSDAGIPEIADMLMTEVSRAVGADRVILFLPDESGNLREVLPLAGSTAGSDQRITHAAAWAVKEMKAVGLPVPLARSKIDISGWPVAISSRDAGIGEAGHDVFIPLQTAVSQEGLLYVEERADGLPYSLRDSQLLVAIANQTAAFLERKRFQVVAVQADALREADKLKSTFVSSVSHELKTPLASISATVSNLLEGDVEWDMALAHQELEAVQEDLQRLNSSISALIDLSRLEAAAWEPGTDWYEFGEVLGTALARIPKKQQLRVSFDLPDDLPLIKVDFQQWSRVLQNLLENALIYSPEESPVCVRASATDLEVRMSIEDQGPGIHPGDRERIFEKFYRGDASTRAPSGTGLGLAVTSEIVRFHGGRIWVEDVIPHGARMVISLPREVQQR